MKPLPMPLRIAAGLVATAVEQARELPRLVTELPVTTVSQALQVSMRVQQRITELAIKGDRALGALRPVAEAPEWATFDEDEAQSAVNGASVTTMRPAGRRLPDPLAEPDAADPAADGPDVLPGYPRLTIPQLRGRLRQLDVDELRALLQWEISHDNRPPFVTMLGNRIVTVTEG